MASHSSSQGCSNGSLGQSSTLSSSVDETQRLRELIRRLQADLEHVHTEKEKVDAQVHHLICDLEQQSVALNIYDLQLKMATKNRMEHEVMLQQVQRQLAAVLAREKQALAMGARLKNDLAARDKQCAELGQCLKEYRDKEIEELMSHVSYDDEGRIVRDSTYEEWLRNNHGV